MKIRKSPKKPAVWKKTKKSRRPQKALKRMDLKKMPRGEADPQKKKAKEQ